MSSLKMTFSLTSLILLMAFVAMPVMAHDVPDDDDHNVLGMPNATPAVGHVQGTDHAVVESFVIDTSNLRATNTITATITFAAPVDEVDDVAATADVNEATHAIIDPTDSPAASNIVLNAIKGADGMFTDTGTGLQVIGATQTTAPTATTGAVWTVFIANNANNNTDGSADGEYRLSVTTNTAYSPESAMPVITLDTVAPMIPQPIIVEEGPITGITEDFSIEVTFSEPVLADAIEVEFDPEDKATAGTPVGSRGTQEGHTTFSIPIELATDLEAAFEDDVTISVSATDAAGNEGAPTVITVGLDIAKGSTGDADDPSVTITVSEYDAEARTFKVVVDITPDADADAIKTFDSTYLSAEDVDGSPVDLSVALEDPEDSASAPLEKKSDNKYTAILKYDALAVTPLTITVNQDMLETSNATDSWDVPSEADDMAPVVAIISALQADDTVKFTFTFSEAIPTTGNKAFTIDDLEVTGAEEANEDGELSGVTLETTDNMVFTLTLTPDPDGDGDITVTLKADAVRDNALNAVATKSETYTPEMEEGDTTKPTVVVTAPTELNGLGDAVFTIVFSEALGEGALVTLDVEDFMITGGSETDPPVLSDSSADGLTYTLTVTPASADMAVTVTLLAQVADADGNVVDLEHADSTPSATFDKTPPTVVITAPTEPDADGNLTFTFDFSEDVNFDDNDIDRAGSDNVRLGADSDPVQDTTDSTVYTVLVEPKNPAVATTVLLLKGSVTDMAGNGLAADADATYTPPGAESTDPTITIAAVGYLNVDDEVVGLNCEAGNLLTITATDNEALAADEAVVMSEVSASAGWKIAAGTTEGSIMVVPNGDGTEIGVTSVTVTVAADAVEDAAGNGNAETTMTFTVGPVLTIPAGGYITVIRPEHRGATHLGDPLIVGSLGVRGGVVSIQTWECMPDLHNFYRRTAPGIGGGALVVKESHANNSTTNAVAKGTVGISEIMWAIDLGETFGGLPPTGLSNLDHTREQWVELHNLNAHEVKVTLFARPANAALTAETDEIDRVSNFNVRNAWDVKGQNGDSARGVDFIAMQRGTPTEITGKNYAHGDFNGSNSGKWSASGFTYLTRVPELVVLGQQLAEANRLYDFMGTPGRSNNVAPTGAPVATPIPLKPFVINEVSNRDNRLYEWIEIRNSSDAEANLRNYLISAVTAVDTEEAYFTFPNVDIKLQPNELILVVASDPEDDAEHPLVVGHDVRGGNDQAPGVNANSAKYIVAGSGEKLHTEGLPDNGEFVLFLRRSEAADKTNAASKLKTHEWVIDIAGYHPNLAKAGTYTSLWPLKAFPAPGLTHNKIAVNEVHFRRHADRDGTKTTDGNKHDKTALGNAGYTGIGYRRHATNSAAHGGTPGYHDIRKAKVADLESTGIVTISEIMFDRGDRDNYPQWIELYNSSATEAVNLHADDGWRLEIQNYDDGEISIDLISGTLNFKTSEVQTLLPQQTVLIASTRARGDAGSHSVNAGVVFIPTRVFSVWSDARGALGMKRSTDPILSSEAFYLRLIDGKGNLSDEAGNLTRRRVRGADAYWNWSEVQGEAEMDARSSVIRRYRAPEAGIRSELWERLEDDEILDMGIEAAGWVSAAQTEFRDVERTWYGDEDDYGTPGTTTGRPLPVSLSKFRPERLDDGAVVIRWITESELNNAGFNILRSDTRKGQFTQMNTSLIAGKGTTSERTTYEWKDSTAKPNVVYYYQIQDVSLDGQVQTLRQSRLKGDISAAGKLTTTWGELKALQ